MVIDQAFADFAEAWLRACRRALRQTGTIWVIGTYHNIFRCPAGDRADRRRSAPAV